MNFLFLLPAETSALAALALIAFSFLTSAISAAFGLGGGVAMLIALLSLTPPIVALPVHVQRFPEQAFRQIFKTVLTILAVRLLYKAILT